MTELLGLIAERGYPVSALYPATMPIYRSLGWEQAGRRYSAAVPSRELRSLLAPDAALPRGDGAVPADLAAAVNAVEVRRAAPEDAEAVIAVTGKAHEAARHSGPLTRDAETIARWLSRDGLYTYLAHDGFLAYRWTDGGEELHVERLTAVSPLTARALWSVVASHSTIAETVQAVVAPEDPLWWLTRERDVTVRRRSMWMLRVVDAPAAIAARGFPPGLELSVPLAIADAVRPSSEGRWRLEIADAKGALVPDGDGHRDALALGARGLAALFGGTPMTSLRLAGLAAGGSPETDAALDAAFTGPAFLLDAF
jgi:predicted acetyltransferase